MFKLLLLVIALTGAGAAIPHIVKGKDAVAHSKPWLLTIFKYKDRPIVHEASSCGASLLRLKPDEGWSDMAISAAHCFGFGMFPVNLRAQACHNKPHLFRQHKVVAGSHDLGGPDEGEVEVGISDGQCHENWTPDGRVNDLAVFRLDQPVNFTKTIQPIDLAAKGDNVKAGTRCNVAGWGAVKFGIEGDPDSAIGPSVLQELDVQVLSDAECENRARDSEFDAEKSYCDSPTNSDGGHPCIGDSGGPLVCPGPDNKPIQYGLISYGFGNCMIIENVTINAYPKIPYYFDWIEKEVQRLRERQLNGTSRDPDDPFP